MFMGVFIKKLILKKVSRQKQKDENKTNSPNLYPPMKGYFRETYKSQNINPIYLNPKLTFRIIQIIANHCQVWFRSKFNKNNILTSAQLQYLIF